jgi:hypothetical protein
MISARYVSLMVYLLFGGELIVGSVARISQFVTLMQLHFLNLNYETMYQSWRLYNINSLHKSVLNSFMHLISYPGSKLQLKMVTLTANLLMD